MFYDQFLYCIAFRLQEVSCLRNLDHASISDTIECRRSWREIAQQRWANITKSSKHNSHTTLARQLRKEITREVEQDLHDLAEILLTTRINFKLVVSTNVGWIYTNDVALIKQLNSLKMFKSVRCTKAVVDRPKNTILLKNPKHQFRSYFKSTKLSIQQKDQLISFLNNQTTVRLGPALISWTKQSFYRTQDYFFIDYNEPAWLTMLALVHPGLIRKTQQIMPAK